MPLTANSVHNSLFFHEPLTALESGRVTVHGSSATIPQVSDDDLTTYSVQRDIDVDISDNGNPTAVDAIVVIGSGITSHRADATGGSGTGYTTRTMPSEVTGIDGRTVSTTVNGLQYDLFLLIGSAAFTATDVRMVFTGSTARIYGVALLRYGVEVGNGDFRAITPDAIDRIGGVNQSGGTLTRTPHDAGDRPKWQVNYETAIIEGQTLVQVSDELMYWLADNHNFFHSPEYSRHPSQLFLATRISDDVQWSYRNTFKGLGELVSFSVGAQ